MKSRDKESLEQKKKDAQRIKALEKANMQQAVNHVSAQNDPLAFRQRGTLSMPTPAVSDRELAQISKELHKAESGMPPPPSLNDKAATNALLIDYSDRPLPTPMRTPQGGVQRADIIMQEALNQKRISEASTPLFGGDNAELQQGTGFDGATPLPRGGDVSVLSTSTSATPLPNATPSSRDQFGLNAKRPAPADFSDTASYASFASSVRTTAKEERRAAKKARLELSAALSALPAPQFEYELAIPEEPSAGGEEVAMEVEEDAADVAARLEEIARLEKEVEFAARTTVTKRPEELPRVPVSDTASSGIGGEEAALIEKETVELLKYDAWKYPVEAADGKKKGKKDKKVAVVAAAANPIQNIPLSAIEAAKEALEAEAVKTLPVKIEELSRLTTEKSLAGAEGMVYLGPALGWKSGSVSKAEMLAALKLEFDMIEEGVSAIVKKSDKVGAKLAIKFGGYEKREKEKRAEIVQGIKQIAEVTIEKEVYERLGGMESIAIPKRISELQHDIDCMAARQSELQKRYSVLAE